VQGGPRGTSRERAWGVDITLIGVRRGNLRPLGLAGIGAFPAEVPPDRTIRYDRVAVVSPAHAAGLGALKPPSLAEHDVAQEPDRQ